MTATVDLTDVVATAPDAGGAPSAPPSPSAPSVPSLSPSRAADFKACPLLYRFRTIDRLPERPSPVAARGTLVHLVLERLYDLPPAARTPGQARALLGPAWQQLQGEQPELAALLRQPPEQVVDDPAEADEADGPEQRVGAWLDSAGALLDTYFTLEDPTRLEPAARELAVETVVDGVRLRGFVDRLDATADGALRVVDYKTGTSPREAFEGKALFQLKFYALVLWRSRGVVPSALKLIYLADADTLTYTPDADELARFERTVLAIWTAIDQARASGDFRPNPGRLCAWCDHHAACPAQGGVLPPLPAAVG